MRFFVLFLCACSSDPPATDAGTRDGSGSFDAGSSERDAATDAGEPSTLLLPVEGAEVHYSVAIRLDAPGAASAEVEVVDRPELACSADDVWFECLLDVTPLAAGPFSIRVRALDAGGRTIFETTRALVKRDIPNPCDGVAGDLTDCVNSLATAGTAAGFTGVTYLNCDDTHARADTSRLTGIDARVLPGVPMMPLPDVTLGIANESRACNHPDGWESIPRCYAALTANGWFEANVLLFWPEHRDHGMRDFYSWQPGHFMLSQGSSGSELDEVQKALLALGILRPPVRTALESSNLVAATIANLLRRSRLASDAELLTQEGQVLALGDADNALSMLTLAAAIREGELPPIARATADASETPTEWGFRSTITTPTTIGFGPFMTGAAMAGRFVVHVDVSGSTDPEGAPLVIFPALLRGDPADVTIVRDDEAGTRWTISGSYPADRTISTGGYDRIVSRVTVGFFPHDGLWIGTPAMVSVDGRGPNEHAPDANNLD